MAGSAPSGAAAARLGRLWAGAVQGWGREGRPGSFSGAKASVRYQRALRPALPPPRPARPAWEAGRAGDRLQALQPGCPAGPRSPPSCRASAGREGPSGPCPWPWGRPREPVVAASRGAASVCASWKLRGVCGPVCCAYKWTGGACVRRAGLEALLLGGGGGIPMRRCTFLRHPLAGDPWPISPLGSPAGRDQVHNQDAMSSAQAPRGLAVLHLPPGKGA